MRGAAPAVHGRRARMLKDGNVPPQASSIARRPGPLQAFQQAVSFHEQGRLWEATQLYEIVLKADAHHYEPVYRLAPIRLQPAKFADATHLFPRTLKIDKN